MVEQKPKNRHTYAAENLRLFVDAGNVCLNMNRYMRLIPNNIREQDCICCKKVLPLERGNKTAEHNVP